MGKVIFDVGANNGHTFYRNAISGDTVENNGLIGEEQNIHFKKKNT